MIVLAVGYAFYSISVFGVSKPQPSVHLPTDETLLLIVT